MSDNPIRVKIKGNGTQQNTVVTDAESGREIICESATLMLSASGLPKLTITVLDFEVEVQGVDTKPFRTKVSPR